MEECNKCSGSGTDVVLCPECHMQGLYYLCSHCNGIGTYSEECRVCGGDGEVKEGENSLF